MNSKESKKRAWIVFAAVVAVGLGMLASAFLLLHKSGSEYIAVPQEQTASPIPLEPAPTTKPPCLHPSHDALTGCCTACGEKVCHEYMSGECSCGKKLEFTTSNFDSTLWDACPHPGTVEKIEYSLSDVYYQDRKTYTKTMEVYLPYGYSAENRYNVLVLLHGTKGDETYWFTKERGYEYNDGHVAEWGPFSTVIDNMIDRKLCEPLIIVSPTYYLNDSERHSGDFLDRDIVRVRYELVNNIIPAVITNFSTYAEDASYASMCAARDHFGIIGASYGGILTYKSAITYDIDVFSWIGSVSGAYADVNFIEYMWNYLGYNSLDLHYLYTSAGDHDSMRKDAKDGYRQMLSSSKINESNICYCEIEDAEHEERVWDNALYNCLQFFFAGYNS